MITISKEDFLNFVPAALEPSGNAFLKLQPFINNATTNLQIELLGPVAHEINYDLLMLNAAKKTICLNAFFNAIPTLDLILTANGFGITNTQNVAPASKERVDRLRDQMFNEYLNAFEQLLLLLYNDIQQIGELWRNNFAKFVIKHLVFTSTDFRNVSGHFNANRKDLVDAYPVFEQANSIIANVISKDYLNELLAKNRTNTLTIYDNLIVNLIKKFYTSTLSNFNDKAILHNMLNIIDNNQAEFPTYFNSQEYKARNTTGYENKLQQPTFFFA